MEEKLKLLNLENIKEDICCVRISKYDKTKLSLTSINRNQPNRFSMTRGVGRGLSSIIYFHEGYQLKSRLFLKLLYVLLVMEMYKQAGFQ